VRIEAVTVCIGYADFLAETIPYNLPVLDRWLIVTSPQDEETRELCRRHSLEVLITENHKRNEGKDFAKGRVVEYGMRQLSSDAWHLHMDGDIVLPRRFRHLLESAHLKSNHIYGCDRVMVKSWEQWQALKNSGWLDNQGDYHCRVHFPPGYEVGTRWCAPDLGYIPIGFFQLAHPDRTEFKGVRQNSYPSRHADACRTDVQYGAKWDRRHRELLPELIVAHLESEPAKLGANWAGRTTKRFAPPTASKDGTGNKGGKPNSGMNAS